MNFFQVDIIYKINILGLWLIVLSGFSLSTIYSYILLIIMLVINFINLLHTRVKYKFVILDSIPLFFLLMWVYGVLIGFIYHNKIEYIVRNYAGIVFYILYFILIFSHKITKEKIFNFLIFSSIIISIIAVLYAVYISVSINNFELLFRGTGGLRFYYFNNMSLFYIAFTFSFLNIALPKEELKKFNYFHRIYYSYIILIVSLLAIILSGSRGYFLGLVLLSILLIGIYLYRLLLERDKIYVYLTYGIISVFGFILVYYAITYIFSSGYSGNKIRYEQFNYLLNDLTFFGKGLGALVTGIETSGYGFELNYLNVVHKFGLFSLLAIIAYLMTVYYIYEKIKNKLAVGLLLSSGMFYMFPAIGNPILFSPINVILHVLVLYLLREEKFKI